MNNSNSQKMRMSLPPGTKVQGEQNAYIVKKFICMSSRSTTVFCESSNGTAYRLKFYNGQHGITNDLQKKTKAVAAKGVIVPVDFGEYGGCPFAVYQNIDGTDASKYPVSLSVLVQKIIPQLAYVIHQHHQRRILLRDICPENILYRVHDQQITYCGFSNMAVLPDNVTITKASGYGQHHAYIAPEVPKYGYSTCSDYYALGVTILSLLLGKNPMDSMSWGDIQISLRDGKVPGIDIQHLKSIPYDLYSEEDKVMYLILGLMLPNPRDRWGYGEIRCWCNKQHIPLTRKGGKIIYQYNEPFVIGNSKCWNYQQLTLRIAADQHAWSESTYARLDQFAKKHCIPNWAKIADMNTEHPSANNGRMFRAIYGINPALDGFWWVGRKYANSTQLIQDAAANKTAADVLSEILKNHCMSFFLRMRKRITSISETDISEMEQIEQWEIAEPGKGVNRCVMRFASSAETRSFWINGKEYPDTDSLLSDYANAGLRLKQISGEIINSKSFQAWLWVNGMEAAGQAAQKLGSSSPEQSFYLLMKIIEKSSKSENTKHAARRMYLKYGEYAPVYWLYERITDYLTVSIGDQILFDTFKNADLSLTNSLEVLSSNVNQLVPDYFHFVARTSKKTIDLKQYDLEFCDFSFYPSSPEGFFCCRWENGFEVTPSFLRSIGASSQKIS